MARIARFLNSGPEGSAVGGTMEIPAPASSTKSSTDLTICRPSSGRDMRSIAEIPVVASSRTGDRRGCAKGAEGRLRALDTREQPDCALDLSHSRTLRRIRLPQWCYSSVTRPLHRPIACFTKTGAKLQHSFCDE